MGLIPALGDLGWTSEVHAPAEAGTDGRAIERLPASFKTFRARYPYLGLDAQRRARMVASGGNLVSPGELLALLRSPGAHVLHAHTLGRLGGVVRTAARLRRIPYAVTLHGPVRANAAIVREDAAVRTRGLVDLGAPFGWAVGARRVVQDADMVFALNVGERDAWRADRGAKHLELVVHGVDPTPASHGARAEARALAGEGPFALVVARLDRNKGQDVALEAFARGAPQDLRLVFAGAPVDEGFAASLRARAEALGGRVRILGGVTPRIARALMAESEIVLAPSRAEPFGIVLLEAWAEGAAVLFSAVDGLADIARRVGVERGLVPPGDVDSWTLRLRAALADAAWLDEEHRSAHARVVANYTWASLARHTVRAYQEASISRKAA